MATKTPRRPLLLPILPVGAPYSPPVQSAQTYLEPNPVARTQDGRPSLRIPESATIVGDKTGKEYANIGDSPNGVPELMSITPQDGTRPSLAGAVGANGVSMAGGGQATVGGGPPFLDEENDSAEERRMKLAWLAKGGTPESFYEEYSNLGPGYAARAGKGPVSMAGGGYAVVGGGSSSSPDDALLREILSLRRAQLNAQTNVPDMEAVGTAQTIQNTDDQMRLGALGIAAPANIDMPAGSNYNLNALTRPSLRTQADILGEQINQKQQEVSLNQAERSMQGAQGAPLLGGSGGGGSSGGGRPTLRAGGSGGSSAGGSAPGGSGQYVRVTDPTTGQTHTVALEDAQAAQIDLQGKSTKLATAQRANEDAAAKLKGLVPYDMPNGEHVYLSPAEASVRKAIDAQNTKKAAEAALNQAAPSPYQNTSISGLVDFAVRGSLPIVDMKSELQARVIRGELGPKEADVLVNDALLQIKEKKGKSGRTATPEQEAKALELFGRAYSSLGLFDKEKVDTALTPGNSDPVNPLPVGAAF